MGHLPRFLPLHHLHWLAATVYVQNINTRWRASCPSIFATSNPCFLKRLLTLSVKRYPGWCISFLISYEFMCLCINPLRHFEYTSFTSRYQQNYVVMPVMSCFMYSMCTMRPTTTEEISMLVLIPLCTHDCAYVYGSVCLHVSHVLTEAGMHTPLFCIVRTTSCAYGVRFSHTLTLMQSLPLLSFSHCHTHTDWNERQTAAPEVAAAKRSHIEQQQLLFWRVKVEELHQTWVFL